MRLDWPGVSDARAVLRADGGMAANDWMLQFLADILDIAVERPGILETTALGAAYLAGLACGLCPPPEEFAQKPVSMQRFEPRMDAQTRAVKYDGWRDAVRRTRSSPTPSP
jgi:glycerol kinase